MFCGEALGKGLMTYHNGDVYSGYFQDSALHGKIVRLVVEILGRGEFRYQGGAVHVGSWKNGMKHGRFPRLRWLNF